MHILKMGVVIIVMNFCGLMKAVAGLNCFERIQSSASMDNDRSKSEVSVVRTSILDVENKVSKLRQEKFLNGQWVTVSEIPVVFSKKPSLESMEEATIDEEDSARPVKLYTTYESSYLPAGGFEGSTRLRLGVYTQLEPNGSFSAILQTKAPMLPLRQSNFYCLRIAKPF